MTTTIVRKKAPKEPSIEKLARRHARNGAKLRQRETAEKASCCLIAYSWHEGEQKQLKCLKCRKPLIWEPVLAIPAGVTSTTTPAGIAVHDPDAVSPMRTTEDGRWQEGPSGGIVTLDVDCLLRHPDNRDPTPSDVAAMVDSFTEVGQLEPLLVWQPPQFDKACFEIISGETRWLAAKQLKWATVQARIADGIDEAQALELVARANGERRDLNPIQKARLVARLCDAKEKGGAGLTREQAGRHVGVESGGAASNLVRLLELPKVWQDRVASGELPWTWAREILPVVKLGPVMEHLDGAWKERGKRGGRYNGDTFDSRNEMQWGIEAFMHNFCRRLDEKHWVEGGERLLKVDTTVPAIREKLGIVEVELPSGKKGQTKTVEVATNADAFRAMLQKQGQRAAKADAQKVGEEKKAAKQTLSPAEKRKKTEDRNRQLGDRIESWRHKLLRREIARLIDEGKDNGLRVVLAFATKPPHRGPGFGMCLHAGGVLINRIDTWDEVVGFRKERQEEEIARVAQHMLTLESDDHRWPVFEFDLIEKYAEALHVDVAAAWARLQEPGKDGVRGAEMLEELFLFHQTAELADLANEFKVHLPPAVKTRPQIVKLLLSIPQGTTRRLPLPKSIAPVAVSGKSKTKAKRR